MSGARSLRPRARRARRVPALAHPDAVVDVVDMPPGRDAARAIASSMARPVLVIALDVATSTGIAIALVDATGRRAHVRVLATVDSTSILRRNDCLYVAQQVVADCGAEVLVVHESWSLGGLERAAILSMGASLGRWREAIATRLGSTWRAVHVEDWRLHWLGRAKVSRDVGKALALARLASIASSTGAEKFKGRDHNAAEALGMLAWAVAYGVDKLLDEQEGVGR